MKINIDDWKVFNFTDIFVIKKGFYNKKPEPSGQGKIPFLGATDSNNGVTEFYTYDEIESASKTGDGKNDTIDKKLFPGHAVCVTNNGSVGYAYYQEKQFTCSHDVNPLYKKDGDFNQFTGLFVASVIMYDRYRWGYGRKWRPERMKKSQIILPIKHNLDGTPFIDNQKKYSSEGFVPDWERMEQFIKKLHYKKITTNNKNETTQLDTSKWEIFYLHKLFNADMGNGINSILTTSDNPKYNYVSRDSNGNGVVDFVDQIEGEEPFKAGTMTLALGGSYLGSCFIQSKDFYTAQNVGILQEKVPLTIFTKLFIATLIRNECKIKFQAFGRELNAHFRKDFTIKLPIKYKDGKPLIDSDKEFSDEGFVPDWEWMDSYMKNLPFGDKIPIA